MILAIDLVRGQTCVPGVTFWSGCTGLAFRTLFSAECLNELLKRTGIALFDRHLIDCFHGKRIVIAVSGLSRTLSARPGQEHRPRKQAGEQTSLKIFHKKIPLK